MSVMRKRHVIVHNYNFEETVKITVNRRKKIKTHYHYIVLKVIRQ